MFVRLGVFNGLNPQSLFNLGAQRHSGKSPSSEASADRWGMKAQPRTIVNTTSKLN